MTDRNNKHFVKSIHSSVCLAPKIPTDLINFNISPAISAFAN